MAGSSDANNVPEGTTLVFGSWACTDGGSGGFFNHLVMTNSPKPKITPQLGDIRKSADLNEKRVLLELVSDKAENVSTPTRIYELAESDANSDPKNHHFSETLEKYLT